MSQLVLSSVLWLFSLEFHNHTRTWVITRQSLHSWKLEMMNLPFHSKKLGHFRTTAMFLLGEDLPCFSRLGWVGTCHPKSPQSKCMDLEFEAVIAGQLAVHPPSWSMAWMVPRPNLKCSPSLVALPVDFCPTHWFVKISVLLFRYLLFWYLSFQSCPIFLIFLMWLKGWAPLSEYLFWVSERELVKWEKDLKK